MVITPYFIFFSVNWNFGHLGTSTYDIGDKRTDHFLNSLEFIARASSPALRQFYHTLNTT